MLENTDSLNQVKTIGSNNAVEPDNSQEVQTLALQLKQTHLAYQMATQMSQFKAGFLARVSHELRSPLNGVIGSLELVLSDLCDDPAEEREFLSKAKASALKMMQMLDQILDVARAEHGKNPVKLEALGLTDVFEELYYLTQLQAANRNIRLEFKTPDPEVKVLADDRWLKQVLLNLVDTPIGQLKMGSICVSASASPASGCVYIWIDYPGTADIWSEPLDLLQSAPVSDGPIEENHNISPGMILFMNQTILELMQGRLEVLPAPPNSEESALTRIQCTLPLVIPE